MDVALFEFFNQDLANPVFDAILPYWRKRETWVPLYIGLAAWMLWRDWRRALWVLAATIAAVALTDFITSGLIKPWAGRLRPCADPSLGEQVRVLVSCGGGLSFPSSHASNHLALALVLGYGWFGDRAWLRWALIAWAVSISLAQIYVGKHFPTDIVGGWIVGAAVAALVLWLLRTYSGRGYRD